MSGESVRIPSAPAARPRPWEVTAGVRHWALACALLFFVAAPLTILTLDPWLTHQIARLPPDLVISFGHITEIGNSRWYLFPALALALGCWLVARSGRVGDQARRLWRWFSGASFFVFLSIFGPGFVVNLMKWTIGRARPKLLLREDTYGFEPFILLVPNWNSFPSGHAQVSLCVALAFGALFPKLRGFLLALAVVIAVSRIVLLVHFISDVMASIALSLALFWIIQNWYRDKGWLFRPAPWGGWRVKPEGRWLKRQLRRAITGRLSGARG